MVLDSLSAQVRDPANGRVLFGPIGGESRVAAWSPDSHYLAVAYGRLPNGRDEERRIEIWDLWSNALVRTIYTQSDNPSALSWSRDGRLIAFGDLLVPEQYLWIWRVSSGELVRTIKLDHSSASTLSWGPDSRLAIGFPNRGVEIWNLDEKAIENAACDYITRNLTQAEWNRVFTGHCLPSNLPIARIALKRAI